MHKLLSNDISIMAKKSRKKDATMKVLIYFCSLLTMAILSVAVIK
jgi:hypothetical protein